MYHVFNDTDYNELYTRYLQKRSEYEFLEIYRSQTGNTFFRARVLDLCCGTGRLGIEIDRVGLQAQVDFVDMSFGMVGNLLDEYKVYVRTVEEHLALTKPETYDAVFCQQAVNYWFDAYSVELLAKALIPGGIFMFNTFNRKPPSEPTHKSYVINGEKYMELYQLLPDDTVFHVQMKEKHEPHISSFKWIPWERFQVFLGRYFDVRVITEGATDIYICRKK